MFNQKKKTNTYKFILIMKQIYLYTYPYSEFPTTAINIKIFKYGYRVMIQLFNIGIYFIVPIRYLLQFNFIVKRSFFLFIFDFQISTKKKFGLYICNLPTFRVTYRLFFFIQVQLFRFKNINRREKYCSYTLYHFNYNINIHDSTIVVYNKVRL